MRFKDFLKWYTCCVDLCVGQSVMQPSTSWKLLQFSSGRKIYMMRYGNYGSQWISLANSFICVYCSAMDSFGSWTNHAPTILCTWAPMKERTLLMGPSGWWRNSIIWCWEIRSFWSSNALSIRFSSFTPLYCLLWGQWSYQVNWNNCYQSVGCIKSS